MRPFCTSSPLMALPSSRSSRFVNSSWVTTHGPVGAKPGNDLPRLNCGAGPASWLTRSEMSCPTVRPATCAHPSASATLRAGLPTTATSSTSQSVWPPGGSVTSVTGPVRLETNLVNTGGALSGASRPDSAACSR